MPDLVAELTEFVGRYEQANNSHDIDRVKPLIAEDAVYWFSDGSYRGKEAIAAAVVRTFAAIADEVYRISGLEWVSVEESTAVCRYRFAWSGVVDGKQASGEGRGTNVLVKRGGQWLMLHEHLSS